MEMTALGPKLTRGDFLILGRAGMDMSADPPGTAAEHARSFRSSLGGSSANIAAGLCKLGARAALVTSVSDDSVGRFCLNELERYGVDRQYVRTVGGEFRNSLAIYESRVEDFNNTIYRNGAADFQVTVEDIDAVDFTAYSAVVTTGTVFAAEPSRGATFHAFERAKAAGLPIIFDIDYRPYSWPSADVASEVLTRAGGFCDIIVGNDEEFDFMAGGRGKGLEMARALADGSAAIVVYKMGPEGAITFWDGKEVRTGIYRVDALKPVGAGDAFMAGFLSGLVQGLDVGAAVLRGSASAAITVSRPGCAPAIPTPDELSEFLEQHPGPSEV
jgi:5-dehydro-2-deoxygluconokinase